MPSSTSLSNSASLYGGCQQREQNYRSTTPLRHYIDPPQLLLLLQHQQKLSPLPSSLESVHCAVKGIEPLTTTATKAHFAIWSIKDNFPIDCIAANDLLRGIPSRTCNTSYSMLPIPSSKDGNVRDSKQEQFGGDKKRNSLAGFGFSFSSLASPTRRGLINNVAPIIAPGRRPVTPPDVAKAWQGTSVSTKRPKEPTELRQSPSRTIQASPNNRSTTNTSRSVDKEVHSWSDTELAARYTFDREIGFGNWGSCWLVECRTKSEGLEVGTKLAIKLVHREGNAPSNARVKALWNEFKVLRACGKPLHDNLVSFKEFAITPSYALIVMEHYQQSMNVALPISTYAGSTGYFQQLLSAINWLHTRSVTHCDIKVANLLVDTREDQEKGRPILVDFGFATLHDSNTNFKSRQSWGTPEYLSPERCKGQLHDERLSDIWALGVTFFEIATGRTPYEHEDEQFLSKDQLEIYYKRTLSQKWVGTWSFPRALESLCRLMLRPDPKDRLTSGEALLHPFFSKPGSYYKTTVITNSDEEKYKDAIEVQIEEEASELDEPNKEESKADYKAKNLSKTKPPPLRVPSKEKNVEQNSPFASPRGDLKDMRQSLKVPVLSPLSSHQSRSDLDLSIDDGNAESRYRQFGKDDTNNGNHLQGEYLSSQIESDRNNRVHNADTATLLNLQGSAKEQQSQAKKGNSRCESSHRLSSNVEETLSSSREAARSTHQKQIDKAKRPRPKTFHGAMFDRKEVRQLKSSVQEMAAMNNSPHPYKTTNEERSCKGEPQCSHNLHTRKGNRAFLKGYEIMPKKYTPACKTKDSGREREVLDKRMQTIAGKARELQTELEQYEDKEEISPGCSDASAFSQVHTEDLAARLDEMGVLAANLARMVEESKSKLNCLQESSMARSVASLHGEKWNKADALLPSTSHLRQYSGNNMETLNCASSVHSQTYAASITSTAATPPSTNKTRGIGLLKSGSLRRKISLTGSQRKPTISSTVPFPSEASSDHLALGNLDSERHTPARMQRDGRVAQSPTVLNPREEPPRNNLNRASSGRSRALSHFLTRYGPRNTRPASNFRTSSEVEVERDDTTRSGSTLYDGNVSTEVFDGKRASTKAGLSKKLSKHFFDDESVVEISASDYTRQSKSYKEGHSFEGTKSPLQSRPTITTNRRSSRVYQSANNMVSSSLGSRKQSMSGTPSSACRVTGKIPATNTPTSVQGGKQRERTLSKMKSSFNMGRSNTISRRNDSTQSTPFASKGIKDRSTDISSSHHQGDSIEKSTAALVSYPIEPISPRHNQFPALTPLTPMIGEDPPRHSQVRSRESSSQQSHQSLYTVTNPSTPGGGLWTRLFRSNYYNGINGSSRFQSPRAS